MGERVGEFVKLIRVEKFCGNFEEQN